MLLQQRRTPKSQLFSQPPPRRYSCGPAGIKQAALRAKAAAAPRCAARDAKSAAPPRGQRPLPAAPPPAGGAGSAGGPPRSAQRRRKASALGPSPAPRLRSRVPRGGGTPTAATRRTGGTATHPARQRTGQATRAAAVRSTNRQPALRGAQCRTGTRRSGTAALEAAAQLPQSGLKPPSLEEALQSPLLSLQAVLEIEKANSPGSTPPLRAESSHSPEGSLPGPGFMAAAPECPVMLMVGSCERAGGPEGHWGLHVTKAGAEQPAAVRTWVGL